VQQNGEPDIDVRDELKAILDLLKKAL
jgi:hypothetical protein